MGHHKSAPGLNHDDQLSLWVGRVARLHALLEYSLSNVYEMLRPRGGLSSMPPNVGELVTACSRLLRTSELSDQLVDAGSLALRAAQEANAARNRIVHDMWLPSGESDSSDAPSWTAFRRMLGERPPYANSTTHQLDTVIDAHDRLVRTRLRVSGLFMALHEVMPGSVTRRQRDPQSQMPRYLALMEDRFKLEDNGDVAISEPS